MPFDRDELLEEYEDDTETLARMLEIFDRDAGDRIEKIRAAIDSNACEALMNEAHAIKGGLGTFFATSTYELAYKLEMMGRDQNTSGAQETFAAFQTELKVLRSALGELIEDA
jgi:HPt (histidine-containing phosphotransfer) domain-containing protein